MCCDFWLCKSCGNVEFEKQKESKFFEKQQLSRDFFGRTEIVSRKIWERTKLFPDFFGRKQLSQKIKWANNVFNKLKCTLMVPKDTLGSVMVNTNTVGGTWTHNL